MSLSALRGRWMSLEQQARRLEGAVVVLLELTNRVPEIEPSLVALARRVERRAHATRKRAQAANARVAAYLRAHPDQIGAP